MKFINRVSVVLIISISVFLMPCACYAEDFILCNGFSYHDIPVETQKLMNGKSYKENEYVKFDDLRFCKVLHIGFDGKEHEGELIVARDYISETGEIIDFSKEVLEIFKEMYDAKYPIEKIRLIDYYDAEDEKSMLDNNSSSFIFRYILGTNRISWHSYGLAIDINPYVNPCFHPDSKTVEPVGTEKFLNRSLEQAGLIKEGDACHKAFTSRGWEWGGSWKDPNYSTDYMHFAKFPRFSQKPSPKYANKK